MKTLFVVMKNLITIKVRDISVVQRTNSFNMTNSYSFNLTDCHFLKNTHRNYQKAVSLEVGSLHYFTDSEYQRIRESAYNTSTYDNSCYQQKYSKR